MHLPVRQHILLLGNKFPFGEQFSYGKINLPGGNTHSLAGILPVGEHIFLWGNHLSLGGNAPCFGGTILYEGKFNFLRGT